MFSAATLIEQTEAERTRLTDLVNGLTDEQANFKPSAETWSINEKIEHLVLAEVSGISKIWSAAEGIRKGKPVWVGDHTNRGKDIGEIISCTWKEKESAPPIATPHIGGPLSYWLEYLRLSRELLKRLEPHLMGLNLEDVLFPHFICGPLDAGQRIQFLTFHIERHRKQIETLMANASFPVA